MEVVQTIEEIRAAQSEGTCVSWALVPTMGALHEGHLTLVRQARAENDRVAVSVFVNPTQFNNADDLKNYPRDLERDVALLEKEGVDLVWAPTPEIMYPPDFQTHVTVTDVTQPLEGAHRPGHFEGVATVVAKLFNAIQPSRAYFGQKDAQQVAVIRQMIRDLNFNVELVVVPIVREPDGLAMSSRNALLNPAQRKAATVLYRALTAAAEQWQSGQHNADALRETLAGTIAAEPLARAEYVSVADPVTLLEIEGEAERALMSMAVYVGEVRLIDNMLLGVEE